jgi:hypothetical protein
MCQTKFAAGSDVNRRLAGIWGDLFDLLLESIYNFYYTLSVAC